MIAMDVQMTTESERMLVRLAAKFPNEVRRAFKWATSIVINKMRKEMRGKKAYPGRWEDFTKRLRSFATADYRHTYGGKLMHPNGKQIVRKPQGGDRFIIGWVGGLENAASIFQEGSVRPTTSSFRQWCYQKGFTHDEVPQIADTPQRPVVDPITAIANENVADWTFGALRKNLSKVIERGAWKYNETPATREGAKAATRAANAMDALKEMSA